MTVNLNAYLSNIQRMIEADIAETRRVSGGAARADAKQTHYENTIRPALQGLQVQVQE